MVFKLAQHSRDQQLMNSLINYLGCGIIQKDSINPAVYFVVSKFSEINNKIIPFFNKFPLQGAKHLDFKDFCKTADLMRNKAHLTAEGLEQIREIKAEMNTGRKY